MLLNRISVSTLFIALFFSAGSFAQDAVKGPLFESATTAKTQALAANADVLAPQSFSAGADLFSKAEKDFSRGRDLDRIRSQLAEASQYFNQAVKSTAVARVTLGKAFQARSDALQAEAQIHAKKTWSSAESTFEYAATRLEEGKLTSAEKEAAKAETAFREAELASIKSNFLNETRALLSKAEDKDADRYAPITFSNAKSLFSKAEKELNENRYDTDQARVLARLAKNEALHTLYLLDVAKRYNDRKVTLEEIILDWETPLKSISASIDLPVYFNDGYTTATANIINRVENTQAQLAQTTEKWTDTQTQLASTARQVTELEQRLGGVSQERLAMAQQIEQENLLKQTISDVENLFNTEEATVLRKGDQIIIRLVGLSFDSGQAVIQPDRFSLLSKLETAINKFPGTPITIEGYTDSFGGDAVNQELSAKRANAVKSYLLANMPLTATDIATVGYGEENPVANNETADGRAKNRRIDVILQSTTELPASKRQ